MRTLPYRYYVHDNKNNVGVTEFSTQIPEVFNECLIDILNWLMWESLDTLDYKVFAFVDGREINFTFGFDEDVQMYTRVNGNTIVYRNDIGDYIKSVF